MLLIGVGNEFRSDDAAGLITARMLFHRIGDKTQIIEMSGEGAALIEAWKNMSAVILIDAVSSGAPAGTIHRLDASTQNIPSDFFHYSSHAFGVAKAVELSRELKNLPPRFIIYGIEGKSFHAGTVLSSEVNKALPVIIDLIVKEIELFSSDN
jgi:hydrogenase maturation protease